MASVPFNLEDTGGAVFGFEVVLIEREGTWLAVALEPIDHPKTLREPGWPSILEWSSWVLAAVIGLGVTALTTALMKLVQQGRRG
jgi:hypothetical protein